MLFLELHFVEFHQFPCVCSGSFTRVKLPCCLWARLSVSKEIVTFNMEDKTFLFSTKDMILPEFLHQEADMVFLLLQNSLQCINFSLVLQQFHSKMMIILLQSLTNCLESTFISSPGRIIKALFCEGRLTLLSSRLSKGLSRLTAHRKFLTASLGRK